jgi:hypothetical protein
MPGQRKSLGFLAEQGRQELDRAAATVPVSSPDRTDSPDRAARPAGAGKAAEEVPTPAVVPAKASPAGDMTMRSWYMPKASADRLAALVDDVHFATRLPKHLIMGALVNVIDRHRDEVEAEARSAAGQ